LGRGLRLRKEGKSQKGRNDQQKRS